MKFMVGFVFNIYIEVSTAELPRAFSQCTLRVSHNDKMISHILYNAHSSVNQLLVFVLQCGSEIYL